MSEAMLPICHTTSQRVEDGTKDKLAVTLKVSVNEVLKQF
jgi:hypothetical protein